MSKHKSGEGQSMDEWNKNVHELIDEMHRRTYVQFRGTGAWQPATNVYEAATSYLICVDLAGVDEQEVDVEVRDGRRVMLQGRRARPTPVDPPDRLSIHVMEIDEGPFRREIELPVAVDVDAVEATYRKGYLWISLPKRTT